MTSGDNKGRAASGVDEDAATTSSSDEEDPERIRHGKWCEEDASGGKEMSAVQGGASALSANFPSRAANLFSSPEARDVTFASNMALN